MGKKALQIKSKQKLQYINLNNGKNKDKNKGY